ncbi:MAG: hypothetical protein ABH804_00660 [archaeon]
MRSTSNTIPEFNLKKIIELRDEILERYNTEETITQRRIDFLTEQYRNIYFKASRMGRDLSNYPAPENLWSKQ